METPEPEILRPSWWRNSALWAGFCTRKGGYGTGVFAELNCSWKWKEEGFGADENHDLLARKEGYDRKRLFLVKQVHGSNGVSTERYPPEVSIRTAGDFLISGTPGDVCGVITADCVPLLIYDPVAPCVAAVHSGWRGTLARVAASAVVALKESYGSNPAHMKVAAGPSIGVCCFEVGRDVEMKFQEAFPSLEGFSSTGQRGRPHIDLCKVIYRTLEDSGVIRENIEVVGGCTFCRPESYFSYRRDGSPIGQHMSFIGLKL